MTLATRFSGHIPGLYEGGVESSRIISTPGLGTRYVTTEFADARPGSEEVVMTFAISQIATASRICRKLLPHSVTIAMVASVPGTLCG